MALSTELVRESKAQAISLLIYSLTGEYPRTYRFNDYTEIYLSPTQLKASQDYFQGTLESEPGDVRVKDSSDIFLPVIYKKYWGYAAGALFLGGLIGYMVKPKGKR